MLAGQLKRGEPSLFFFKQTDLDDHVNNVHSVFDLTSKQYVKRRSDIEVSWVKFALGYRARFIPYDM
jgi:hypothetical protein